MPAEVVAKGSILGKYVPARCVMAVLGSIGMAIVYYQNVNLGVAMVAMVNHTAIHENLSYTAYSKTLSNSTISNRRKDGPFDWDPNLQGTLLTCYFWGFLFQIPLARIAENFSAKWLMFFSVAVNVVCSLLTPVLTKLHTGCLILLRVLQGVGGGASFPAMHVMIASWAPPKERTAMSTIVYVGTFVGTALSILIGEFVLERWGWESVFYVTGAFFYIWIGLWLILIQDNPNKQRFISPEERQMINRSLGTEVNEDHHPAVPWKKVFKSSPFWAILIAHTCSNFSWHMFLVEIPFYIKYILKFNVDRNATISATLYSNMIIFLISLGIILHCLQIKGKISATGARKIATSVSSLVPGACLIILCFIGCQQDEAVAVMTVGILAMTAKIPGFLTNHIDIAPKYAGNLVALTNTVAILPGIVVPIFVALITDGYKSIGGWHIIFGVTIFLFAVEFVVFVKFGSGKEQSWNKTPEENEDEQIPLRKINNFKSLLR
ncbi:sialin-like [Drosophila bipectinata]|uniref:sialin-like n=1 Tax=Drosophila bipectinata TaxID=42026 RepID=UPI001C8AD933|nr:sialin-like [Drosophila bipectinata]